MPNVRPQLTQTSLRIILLVEDHRARSNQPPFFDLQRSQGDPKVTVRVHKIVEGEWKKVTGKAQVSRRQMEKGTRGYKQIVALGLLSRGNRLAGDPVIVAGASYGSSPSFIKSLVDKRLDFILEIRPSHRVACEQRGKWVKQRAADALGGAVWRDVEVAPRKGKSSIRYSVADLAEVCLPGGTTGRLFAAQTGRIVGLHPGTIIGLTSLYASPLEDLVRSIGWVRWIRPLVRRQERNLRNPPRLSHGAEAVNNGPGLMLRHRSNITLARLQDKTYEGDSNAIRSGRGPRGVRFAGANVLNVVELFAGAGGMGLGFLMAEHPKRRFRLVFAGELHPVYIQTLRNAHDCLVGMRKSKWRDFVPESIEPLNLNDRKTLELVASKASEVGGVDILIGGPPCQGFSSANRNSWSSTNPQNQMVDVFMRYVEKLSPSVFLIENVQGIAWTARNGRAAIQPSVAGHIVERMKAAGYVTFPKLLDAVWYGAPQFRTRFFVLGIHRDSGYCAADFGDWGPFPTPTHGPLAGRSFVTVREAIGDLPPIGNGHGLDEMDYCESATRGGNKFLRMMRNGSPKTHILDHITSRHAEYVIERYKHIPPGGNWEDIVAMMSNYSRLERTHSNIYRRLEWDEPSITIGNYRKSMLIHPEQHRGLSLREACRLQSFPDWFRFAGTVDAQSGGLVHKQQQLANAVCPLVSKTIAEFLLEL